MKKLILGISILVTTASFACRENSICKDDRVIFDDYTGTAVEVFSNGIVKIKVDTLSDYTYRKASELGKGLNCFQELCVGNRVNFDDYTGIAVEVFSNGIVKIKVDTLSDYTYRKASELGKGLNCFQELCVGNRVNFDDYTGTAVEVFSNGIVKIDVDTLSGYKFLTAAQLGLEVPCVAGSRNCS